MTDFDRVRARTGATAPARPATRVLFSPPAPAPTGAVRVDCGACGKVTALSAARALWTVVPAVHLPLLALAGVRRTSWLRCPACARWSRARVTLALRATVTGAPGAAPAAPP